MLDLRITKKMKSLNLFANRKGNKKDMDNVLTLKNPAETDLHQTIENALQWTAANQDPAGYWVGMLESNVCMEAQWLLAFHILGITDDPKIEGLKQGILDEQRPDGSWEIFYRAPEGDISATVEAYAALRAWGMGPDEAPLQRACQWILDHGGVSGVRVFTRYWLALIGEWPWEKTPNIPPEIIFFPSWFPFCIYNFAAWARATIMPLSILSARRMTRPLPGGKRLDALFPQGRGAVNYDLPARGGSFSWEGFFKAADRFLHRYQRTGFTPGRKNAIRSGLEWIIRHQDADGAWGGIQPPWVYSLMALNAEGYPVTHPVMKKGLSTLDDHWSFTRNGALHIQASESPVWDTLLTLMALQDCGIEYARSESMQKALEWILGQEIRTPGDWQVKIKGVEPGGWAFQRANNFYPDVDDTAVALIVLSKLKPFYSDPTRLDGAMNRARDWLMAMQCRSGGWAAFDKDNNREIITRIPFCDFGEVLDPPSVDVTAHVLEAFGEMGMDRSHPAVARGLKFILKEQESDGSWFGRWGVNYVYGTSAVVCGLKAVGHDMRAPEIRRATDWIKNRQNPDGGWGESCESYMDNRLCGKSVSTASQTAWGLMALIGAEDELYREAIEAGAAFLARTQQEGTWDEPWYTGTGFPGYGVGARIDLSAADTSIQLQQGTELSRGFMINYNLYRHYFPLMALGRAQKMLAGGGKNEAGAEKLKAIN